MTIEQARFKQYDTQDLWRKDRDHILHPWADFPTFEKEGALVMTESEDAYVYDADGKRYLDGIGGLWCVNIGYGREEMAQAIADQVRRLPYYNVFTDTTSAPAAELAAKLAQLCPSPLNHVFFSTGGSVANDSAIRIIHHYFNRLGKPKKKKIISRINAYHGSTYLAMTLTGVLHDHQGFDLVPDLVNYVSCPYTYRRPDGMTEAGFCDFLVDELEQKIVELGPENVACFIAEPIMGAGGVIVPPDGYHQRTEAVCRKYGVLTISDEVVTGFGRLGHFFASQPVFGLSPDVITCAKGLSSGYLPLGATIISDAMYDVISAPDPDGGLFYHGFTYSGHPVSCAAGLKNIEIMEREGLCDHVQDVGPYFEEQLASLLELPIVGDVRGNKFMLCVENVANPETKELLPESVGIGERIAKECEANGLIVRPIGHLNVISPPLTLSRAQVDELVDTLGKAIVTVTDDLARESVL